MRIAGTTTGMLGLACLGVAHYLPAATDATAPQPDPFILIPAGVLLLGLGVGLWLTGWLASSRVSCQDPDILRESKE